MLDFFRLNAIDTFFQQLKSETGVPWFHQWKEISPLVSDEDLRYLQSYYPGDLRHQFGSEQRFRQWIASRSALHQMMEKECSSQMAWVTSLSHTSQSALVCGIVVPQVEVHLWRVGVDLETCTREMSSRVINRVFSSEELLFGPSPIELWTLKEAAFKAFQEPGLVLPQIRVKAWDDHTRSALVISLRSSHQCYVRLLRVKGCVMSCAVWNEIFLLKQSETLHSGTE